MSDGGPKSASSALNSIDSVLYASSGVSFSREMTDEGPRIRGFVCRAFVQYAQATRGEILSAERFLGCTHPLPEPGLDPDLDGLGFLPSRWYPADLVHEVIDIATSGLSTAEMHELAGGAGRNVFHQQITGLQRAIFSLLATPARMAKHSTRAWLHNFSSGRLEYETREGMQRSTYHDWVEHHPLLCRGLMTGRLEAFKAMGLEDVRIKIERCDPKLGCSSTVWRGAAQPDEPESFDARAG